MPKFDFSASTKGAGRKFALQEIGCVSYLITKVIEIALLAKKVTDHL